MKFFSLNFCAASVWSLKLYICSSPRSVGHVSQYNQRPIFLINSHKFQSHISLHVCMGQQKNPTPQMAVTLNIAMGTKSFISSFTSKVCHEVVSGSTLSALENSLSERKL